MRILIVSPFRHDAVGGVASAVRSLGRQFQAEGHEVTLLARGTTNCPVRIPQAGSPPVHTVALRTFGSVGPDRSSLRQMLACLFWFPVALRGLGRFLQQVNPDVVALHYPCPKLFYFGLLRRVSRWKLVVTFQGSDAHNINAYSKVSTSVLRRLLRRADHITFVSTSLRDKVCATFPELNAPMTVIPNGACTDPAEPAQTKTLPLPSRFLLAAGKLIRRKGIDVLIRALAQLSRDGLDVPAVLAGDGEERGRLEALAAAEGVSHLVTFLGEQEQAMAISLMRRAELFVLPSRAEGLPLVVAEAMAQGAPVIATGVDGTPEIVTHNETGLLVEPENADELAAAIRRLWNDAPLRARLSEAGRSHVRQQFSWPAIAARYLACFCCSAEESAADAKDSAANRRSPGPAGPGATGERWSAAARAEIVGVVADDVSTR